MQFTTFVLSALAAVAVTASPVASPEVVALLGEELTARQSWCNPCKNGKHICCIATQCSSYPC
ncbi:uncharacterized protein CTRU02_207377 [Colletotrichum truncatum]|uniref:Uncharacterized protein n=1 Tax=Colletotrichum truncatum TaxID=5467 RepID=A0ACC3Z0M3_COLTU